MRAKYLKGQSFFQHELKLGASFVWRGLVSARQWILKRACFQLEDGSNINVWSNHWVSVLFEKVPRLGKGVVPSRVSKVAELRDEMREYWNEGLVKSLFT